MLSSWQQRGMFWVYEHRICQTWGKIEVLEQNSIILLHRNKLKQQVQPQLCCGIIIIHYAKHQGNLCAASFLNTIIKYYMMHISHIFDQCKPKLIAIRKPECMQIWQLFLFHANNELTLCRTSLK